MAKSLLIVESPTKAKTLSQYLGSDFVVKASVGHIKDLPKNKLGVDIKKGFQPQYVVVPGKQKIIQEIKKAADKVKDIYLGPDPDREGEAIAWHIAEEVKGPNKKIHRALFNELTKKAVTRALKEPAVLDEKKYQAQQARRILDRLVGYLISPLLWEKVRRGLSAGRVQTVALRLICERERAIASFVPQEYWTIAAWLKGSEPPVFEARLAKARGEPLEINNESQANQILEELRKASFVVQDVELKEKLDHPPPPFITSTLQQEAYNRLGFPAKKTMSLAQKLYEGVALKREGQVGLITYMRTDSTRISAEALSAARETIARLFGQDYLPDKAQVYRNKKGAQDAHEAIRPTETSRHPEEVKADLDRDLYALYQLVWSRFLASQTRPALLRSRGVDIEAGQYLFRATETQVAFPGYLAVYPRRKEAEEEVKLPTLRKGEQLTLEELKPAQHFTEPPPRYTEATLIKELEKQGIGRPSTYAAILSNVQGRNYTFKEKGRFYATDLGLLVTDLLVKAFPEVFDVKFTAAMEEELDQIEEGKADRLSGLNQFYRSLKESLEKAKVEMRDLKVEPLVTDLVCEKCGSNLVIKWGKYGQFLACSAFPQCDYTAEYTKDDTGMIQLVRAESGETCEKCGRAMVLKNSRYGRFLACSGYPECQNTRPLPGRSKPKPPVSIGVKCLRPGCAGEIMEKRSKKGRTFYGCSHFPECDLAFWYKPVPQPCPQCGSPYLVEKNSKKRGTFLACAEPSCRYEQEVKAEK